MDNIRRIEINNASDGFPLVCADVPADYLLRAEFSPVRIGDKQLYRYAGKVFSPDGKIRMFFESERRYAELRYEQFPQPVYNGYNQDGSRIQSFCDLKTQMDDFASEIAEERISLKEFHPYSAEMQKRIQSEFDTQIRQEYQVLSQMAQQQGNMTRIEFTNPFIDGGIGEYTSQGRSLFIAFWRGGYESILHEMFRGSLVADYFGWGVKQLAYMVCSPGDRETALPVFMRFAESIAKSNALENYDRQLLQEEIMRSTAKYQQNQNMLNMMWQQQNESWAAVERQRDMLSRDLDSWRSGLNQSMQQNDAFRQAMYGQSSSYGSPSGSGESTDDYIQRLRHEAMMGVNTYVNEEGHETEYTTRADRVFESNLDNQQHFGTEHYYDDYVPDGYTEIHRK